MFENALGHIHFWAFAFLLLYGIYVMIAYKNLVKKLIGMYYLQTAIILFYITLGAKKGATVPILFHGPNVLPPEAFANPLPHVLMLTAIVVGVSTLGLSWGLIILIYRRFKSLNEDDILKEIS